MNSLVKSIGYILLCLVAILILLNFFYIMPNLQLESAKNVYVQEEAVVDTEPERSVVAADSLTIMKESAGDPGKVQLTPSYKNSRNPFFWPEEKTVQRDTDTIPVKKDTRIKPLLSMVIIGKERKQALLDNVFVREGEMFHGYLVKRISVNEVVLSDALGEFRISLAAGDKLDGTALSPVGIIER